MASSDAPSTCGGKLVTKRQRRRVTPYDRPPPPSPATGRSPNWLTGVIFPATRTIVSGAAKFISAVVNSDSSSSSSSEDSDSVSEDDVEDGNAYDVLSHGVGELNKKWGTPLETKKIFTKDPQPTVRRREIKNVIEELVKQEWFSREECNRLIEIINSRVRDPSTVQDGEGITDAETAGRAVECDMADLSSKAVTEARKWLKEKRVGSSTASDLAYGTGGFNSNVFQQIENEAGSPVDMAKSYMKSRPPWASPSTEQLELKTPLTTKSELSKEGLPYSLGSDSLSFSKRNNYLASGSWNIQDEIRRVRSKATENMLHTPSSRKIDASLFSATPRSSQKMLVDDPAIASTREKIDAISYLVEANPKDRPTDLGGVSSSPRLSALEMRKDVLESETVSSNPSDSVPKQYQDPEGRHVADGCAVAASEPSLSQSPNLAVEHCDDPRTRNANGSLAKDLIEIQVQNSNGLPPPQASLSAVVGGEASFQQSDMDNPNLATLNNDMLTNATMVEEKCELLSEASMEVPIVYETNSIPSASENNSVIPHDELLEEPNSENSLLGNPGDLTVKQPGKRVGRYTRRGRGRGK